MIEASGEIIIWNPQLSAADENGKFLLREDSNIQFMLNFVSAFNSHSKYRFAKFIVMLPCRPKGIKFPKNVVCEIQPDAFHTNPIADRYHVNIRLYQKILLKYNVAIKCIFENTPHKVSAWRIAIDTLSKTDQDRYHLDQIYLFSYIHWIDSINFPKYSVTQTKHHYRMIQNAGLAASDLVLCNSPEAKKQILSDSYVNASLIMRTVPIYERVKVLPPFIEPREGVKLKEIKVQEQFRILYNHRLSSMSYYANAFFLLQEALDRLDSHLTGFKPVEVIFTNPTHKTSIDLVEFQNRFKHLKIKEQQCKTRNEYINLVKKCDIVLSTFQDNGGTWSMSLADAIYHNVPPLILSGPGYNYMLPQRYQGIATNPLSLAGIIEKTIQNLMFLTELAGSSYSYHQQMFLPLLWIQKFDSYVDEYINFRNSK